MSDEIEALRAEVKALRAELRANDDDRTVSRRRLLAGLAGLGAAGAAGIATARPAAAADGDPLLIGENNDATTETFLTATFADSESEVILASEPWGVYAVAKNVGVLGGTTTRGSGVWGEDTLGGTGVSGNSSQSGGIGVVATSQTGPALAAQSSVDGVTLELTPAARTGPPTSMPQGLDNYNKGAVSVDAQGEMWLCVAGGAPGTWTRLLRQDTAHGRVIPITPFRALDTRASGGRASGAPVVPGQRSGPLRGGQSVTLDLAGVSTIRATATGVVGNATVLSPDGNGFLRVMPAGASVPASTFNFYDGVTVSNGFTSGLTSAGLRSIAPVSSTIRYHLVIDISAYIT